MMAGLHLGPKEVHNAGSEKIPVQTVPEAPNALDTGKNAVIQPVSSSKPPVNRTGTGNDQQRGVRQPAVPRSSINRGPDHKIPVPVVETVIVASLQQLRDRLAKLGRTRPTCFQGEFAERIARIDKRMEKFSSNTEELPNHDVSGAPPNSKPDLNRHGLPPKPRRKNPDPFAGLSYKELEDQIWENSSRADWR